MPRKKVILTVRQDQVLLFFRQYFKENRRPPTLEEISTHFGWHSKNSAAVHIKVLVRKGKLKKEKGLARDIRLA